MPRISTEQYINKENDVRISYVVNSSKSGIFSTTLPEEAVELLKNAEIRLNYNLRKKPGLFESQTFEGLKKEIKEKLDEALSKELIEEKIVIQYVIETTCSYCLDGDEPVPNGCWVTNGEHHWKDGTKQTDAYRRNPYGLRIYAKPKIKKTFKYCSGKITSKYERIEDYHLKCRKKGDSDYYLAWLDSVTGIDIPDREDPQEVDYTEKTAAFFVNMIKSICNLNERIKNFLDPKSIAEIAEKGIKLLGS